MIHEVKHVAALNVNEYYMVHDFKMLYIRL